jgi:hypothetical protein
LLAISANPDVCSVEVQKVATTHNHNANFLTESEIVDVTPFVTEGIDGTNEVVAVSDSGLDKDNCYFFDPDNDAAVGTSTGPREEIDLSHVGQLLENVLMAREQLMELRLGPKLL